MVQSQVFFGILALRLRLEECTDIPTADVDGVTLRYNPSFIDSLSLPETQGLVCHEVMHCAFDHISRLKTRDHETWNRACDYVINPMILQAGFALPSDVLIDSRFTGKSADTVYRMLLQDKAPSQSQQDERTEAEDDAGGDDSQSDDGASGDAPSDAGGDGDAPSDEPSDSFGGMRPAPDGMTSEGDPIPDAGDWKIAAEQAANAAEKRGQGNALTRAILNSVKHPPVDPAALLRDFVTSQVKSDYSLARPNRRYIAHNLYLPSMVTERPGHIVIAVDTSGSIGRIQLDAFSGMVNAVLEDVKPDLVTVIYCHSRVSGVVQFTPNDYPVTLEITETGGTRFEPVFDEISGFGQDPDCLIYLTDLYGSFPSIVPTYPVLWLSTGDDTAPFGIVVPFNIE
jgi:predicted metal-dependent peptidase